jgi:hypothetical protein
MRPFSSTLPELRRLRELPYQLDFVTPGSRPTDANSRKQIRQTPNFRMYERLRPHSLQRFTCRVEYFAGWDALTIRHFLATQSPPQRLSQAP